MLDRLGGTDVIAVRPREIEFVRGAGNLACMSLTPSGTLRWYAACCRTPIGNTPRDYHQSHVGLIRTALETGGESVSASFGSVRMHVNRQGALGEPPKTPLVVFVWSVLRYLSGTLFSRLSGGYRANPFFDAGTGQPIVAPQVLSHAELARLRSAV
jgi:hypothetical protein